MPTTVAGGASLAEAQPLLARWVAVGLLARRTPCQTR
jgi:hypothetical protein